MTLTATAEHRSFEADVSRLLHMMVHSVYSDRDVFLRELISNAADACEKLRYEAIAQPELLGEEPKLAITIEADAEAGRLVIADNGIGMSRDEMVEALGTIARSGTRSFMERVATADGKDSAQLIGQQAGHARDVQIEAVQIEQEGRGRDVVADAHLNGRS